MESEASPVRSPFKIAQYSPLYPLSQKNPEKVHRWVQERLLVFEEEAKRIAERDVPLAEIWEELTYQVFVQVFLRTVPLTVTARRALGRIKRAVGDDPDAAKLELALPHNVTTEMGFSACSRRDTFAQRPRCDTAAENVH